MPFLGLHECEREEFKPDFPEVGDGGVSADDVSFESGASSGDGGLRAPEDLC